MGLPTLSPSPRARLYLPEVVADKQFQKLLLKLLEGRVQGEEHVVQVPRDRLLQARLSEGVT